VPMWREGIVLVALQYAVTVAGVFTAVGLDRIAIEGAVRRWRRQARVSARAVLVGTKSEFESLVSRLDDGDGHDMRILGFVDPSLMRTSLATKGELARMLAREGAEVLVVSDGLERSTLEMIADAALAARCHLYALPTRLQVRGLVPSVEWCGDQALVSLSRPSLQLHQVALKRVIDVVLGLCGVAVALPILLLVSVAVAVESGRPVFFRQTRLGLGGRPFRCLKVRSMYRGAEQRLRDDPALHREYVANHFKLAPDRDPRLTRVGRIIRRWSLDELPQIFNVLRGEMSLVGPRPIVPEELAHYADDATLFLSLKPGLTGAWAVQGRSSIGYPDRIDLELGYVRSWSLWRDIGILVRTPFAVLGRQGAH